VLVALQDGRASTQRDLARFAKIECSRRWHRCSPAWSGTG
jgi:hypothetical protein